MGEPAELSDADRVLALATARAVVDSVRDDEAFSIAGVETDDAKMLVLTLCQRLLEIERLATNNEAAANINARWRVDAAKRLTDTLNENRRLAVSRRMSDGAYTVGPPPDGRPVGAHLDALVRSRPVTAESDLDRLRAEVERLTNAYAGSHANRREENSTAARLFREQLAVVNELRADRDRLSARVAELESRLAAWHGDAPVSYEDACKVVGALHEQLDDVTSQLDPLTARVAELEKLVLSIEDIVALRFAMNALRDAWCDGRTKNERHAINVLCAMVESQLSKSLDDARSRLKRAR